MLLRLSLATHAKHAIVTKVWECRFVKCFLPSQSNLKSFQNGSREQSGKESPWHLFLFNRRAEARPTERVHFLGRVGKFFERSLMIGSAGIPPLQAGCPKPLGLDPLLWMS